MTQTRQRLLIVGARGRMGRALCRLAADDRQVEVVGSVVDELNTVPEAERLALWSSQHMADVPAFDVAIDFSSPAGCAAITALCVQRRRPLVSGTTGLDEELRHRLTAAARQIPLVWSANFSLGVSVLSQLVQQAATLLPDWDCDIVEVHHTQKRDRPSGTALFLQESVARGGGRAPHLTSLRAGDVVGEHCVQLTGPGERLELVHRATNREIFARGALLVAQRLPGYPPGEYSAQAILAPAPESIASAHVGIARAQQRDDDAP